MKFETILFDMDGVLIDSEELMAKCAILALREYGIDPKPEDFAPFVGRGEDAYIGGVAAKYGLAYRTEMKDLAYDFFGKLVEKEARVPEGILEVLHELKEKGYKMAVCTSADRVKAMHNLRAMHADPSLFDVIVTGDVIVNKKPDPEIYLKGAELTGTKPAGCIVVEDAVSGIRAAHAGGMQVIAITSSFSEAYLREQEAPEYVISDMRSLPDIL